MLKRIVLSLVFLCLLLTQQALGAIGTPVLIESTGTNASVTSLSCTVPGGGVPAGATIFIAFAQAEAASAHSATDTAGNTYALDVNDASQVAADLELHLWRSSTGGALTSGNTITVSWTSSVANIRIVCFYVTGLQTSPAPLDQSTTAEGTGTAVSTGNITTTTADQIIIGVAASSSAATVTTEDAEYTNIGAQTASRGISVAYRIVSATETNDYAPTWVASENWTALIGSFKAAAAAGGATASRLSLQGVGK